MNVKIGDRVLLKDGNVVEVVTVDGRWVDIVSGVNRSWVLRDYIEKVVES